MRVQWSLQLPTEGSAHRDQPLSKPKRGGEYAQNIGYQSKLSVGRNERRKQMIAHCQLMSMLGSFPVAKFNVLLQLPNSFPVAEFNVLFQLLNLMFFSSC